MFIPNLYKLVLRFRFSYYVIFYFYSRNLSRLKRFVRQTFRKRDIMVLRAYTKKNPDENVELLNYPIDQNTITKL